MNFMALKRNLIGIYFLFLYGLGIFFVVRSMINYINLNNFLHYFILITIGLVGSYFGFCIISKKNVGISKYLVLAIEVLKVVKIAWSNLHFRLSYGISLEINIDFHAESFSERLDIAYSSLLYYVGFTLSNPSTSAILAIDVLALAMSIIMIDLIFVSRSDSKESHNL